MPRLRSPRRYGPRILDAAYAALKRVNRRDLVIGGNTWTGGEVLPLTSSGRRGYPAGGDRGWTSTGQPHPNAGPSREPVRFGYADNPTLTLRPLA